MHKDFAKGSLKAIKSCCNLYEMTARFALNDRVICRELKTKTIDDKNEAAQNTECLTINHNVK